MINRSLGGKWELRRRIDSCIKNIMDMIINQKTKKTKYE